ncbi:hypothetical protein [Paracoccus sp. (in: a-proteobacteria)]|uniref:hypothetical protein n=1 Tax=Paracoccus sp. TaxID=267 RepID=UPI00289C3F68|nr:hypothetical protein [Paracoccus sp. (in: a-proteobacteria)]
MVKSFTADLEAFGSLAIEQIKAVLAASIQDVLEAAQLPEAYGGRMPVDTGFLRNSLVSMLNGTEIGKGAYSYLLATTALQPGDFARFAWTAGYAARLEYGFVGEDKRGRTYNQPGRHFVQTAASRWPEFVAQNIARLR